jgi:hypothetical protein
MSSKKIATDPSFKFAAGMLLPATLLVLTSCSSSPPPAWNSETSFAPATYESNQEFGGEVATEAVSTTATVVSVDHVKRLIVLKRADGSSVTYKALPGALGFDVIQAGDEVKVSVAEELAVFLGRNSVPAGAGADTAKLHIRLPDGTQAAAAEVGTLVYTGEIAAINDWDDTVTLQLPGGRTKTIKVSEFVNLADVSVGDTVSVKASEAAVLRLEKL